MDNQKKQKPEIKYPCKWQYKIIGQDVDKMISAVERIVSGFDYEITPSNLSSNEKYYSLNLWVMIPTEFTRNMIFRKLGECGDIRFVI